MNSIIYLAVTLFLMRIFLIILSSLLVLTSCGQKEEAPIATPSKPPVKTESNTVDVGNQQIYSLSGSQVTPIR